MDEGSLIIIGIAGVLIGIVGFLSVITAKMNREDKKQQEGIFNEQGQHINESRPPRGRFQLTKRIKGTCVTGMIIVGVFGLIIWYIHINKDIVGAWQTSETHNPITMRINRDGTGTILRYPLTWIRRGDTLEVRTNLGEGPRSFLFTIDTNHLDSGRAWTLKGQNVTWEFN